MSNRESFNVWNYKPWWCQPWSILLTGIALVGASWFLTKTFWIVAGISIPILVWWGYFLILYPRLARQILASNSLEIESDAKIAGNFQSEKSIEN